MSWYKTGTATFTNSSATVTGSGTAWVANVQVGDSIHAPDGAVYEITGVVSDTELTIDPAYQATTAADASYRIQPTRGWVQSLLTQVNNLLTSFQSAVDGVLAGKFGDGTVAAPALRFLLDQDTGFYRKAAGEMAFSSNGSEKGYFGADGLMGDWVQSSETDGTANRLMKVGAFGLGQNGTVPEIPDVDSTATPVGCYYYSSGTTTNAASRPSGASGTGIITVRRAFSGAILQTLTENTSTAEGGNTWTRTYNNTRATWSSWRLMYDQQTILGTVGQTGGVPTGAVIERGNNSNGEYVRFADGTQICTHVLAGVAVNIAAGGIYESNPVTWTYPAAFTGTSVTTVSAGVDGSGPRWTLARAVNATTAQAKQYQPTSSTTPLDFQLMAIGRWF